MITPPWPAVFAPSEWQMKLLSVLSEDSGFETGRASELAWADRFTGRNGKRIQSMWARGDLLRLEFAGLVSRLDNQKPVAWCRTAKGTGAVRAAHMAARP